MKLFITCGKKTMVLVAAAIYRESNNQVIGRQFLHGPGPFDKHPVHVELMDPETLVLVRMRNAALDINYEGTFSQEELRADPPPHIVFP